MKLSLPRTGLFTEGTELFNKAGLFYSRRVGEMPQRFNAVRNFTQNNPNYEIIENPAVTSLYNATNFLAVPKKFGLGFLMQ
jgi:hypothetical protein